MMRRGVIVVLSILVLGSAPTTLAVQTDYSIRVRFYDDYNANGSWDSNEPEVGETQLNCNGSYTSTGLTDVWTYGTVTIQFACNISPTCDYSWYSLDGGDELCLPDEFVQDIQCTPDEHDCGCPDPLNPSCPS